MFSVVSSATSVCSKPFGTMKGSLQVELPWPYAEPGIGSKPIGPSTAPAALTQIAIAATEATTPPMVLCISVPPFGWRTAGGYWAGSTIRVDLWLVKATGLVNAVRGAPVADDGLVGNRGVAVHAFDSCHIRRRSRCRRVLSSGIQVRARRVRKGGTAMEWAALISWILTAGG